MVCSRALVGLWHPERHAAVAQAIAALEEGKTPAAGQLGPLCEVTRKRFAARKETVATSEAARQKLDVALAHDQFSWQLLSAAAGGQLDLEALTELQIAWQSKDTAELLAGSARTLVLRSLWTICEASRALPEEKELATLAAAAGQLVKATPRPKEGPGTLDPKDPSAIAAALFAALANPDDREYQAQLQTIVKADKEETAETASFRLLARLLGGEPGEADRAKLAGALSGDLLGPDHAVLVALACRRTGNSHWEQFRAASRDLLGNQPLPGEVISLVNRLAQLPSKTTQAAR